MDDDDAPPPLSSLPDQVQALRQGAAAPQGLPVANTTVLDVQAPKKSASLKKGFFDSKPSSRGSKPAETRKQQNNSYEEMPMLKGQRDAMHSSRPHIPDFLRVEPDAEEEKYKKVRGELLDALKPTPDMVNKIQQSPELLAGFEDPEVMAAVNDVAQNPQNIRKYKDNKKVLAFYAAMGGVMGDKLTNMGAK